MGCQGMIALAHHDALDQTSIGSTRNSHTHGRLIQLAGGLAPGGSRRSARHKVLVRRNAIGFLP